MDTDPLLRTRKATTVLLVDDDVAFTKVVQLQLHKYRDHEFTLLLEKTAEAALAAVKANPSIDIILTDYHLSNSNGLELCLQLNELQSHIPIVFITNTRDVKVAVEAMKLGVEDFLVKEELTESLLPRTMINVIDRVALRKQTEAVEKRMFIAEKRAEAIRQLVVTVCHEFNNPLAAIKISTDLMLRQLVDEEDKARLQAFDECFKVIELEIKRLRDINFERIDFQSISLEQRETP